MEKIYHNYGKRLFDILFSSLALIAFSPIFIILIILIRLKLGSPVFYIRGRAGLNGEGFPLYKFRSMTDELDEKGELLPDQERSTPLGNFLRSSSLDELPSLWNILKGDMSLVGPRPLQPNYLPYYTKEEQKRHAVKPGLTGLAQTKGRNSLTWEKRFDYDIYYAEHLSLLFDLKIIIATFLVVLKRSDIGVRGEGVLIDFDVYRQEAKK